MEFGTRVRARRECLGLSQMALTNETGLHFNSVSSVEGGERNISLQNIARLADGLGVDPGTLVRALKVQKERT